MLSGSCWWLGLKGMLLGMAVVGWWSGAEPPGLLNRVSLPPGLSLVLALLLVDLSEYVIHLAYHSVPVLWRLHRVHHSDPQVDLTTTLRQHPVTVLVDVPARLLLWAALGMPLEAVLIYQPVAWAVHLFSHVNAQLPASLEIWLRRTLVTPGFHILHHSRRQSETDSNYGSVLPWWDYLFGTARIPDANACPAPAVGVEEFLDERELWLHRILLQPWRRTRKETA